MRLWRRFFAKSGFAKQGLPRWGGYGGYIEINTGAGFDSKHF
jgi:hypothetical protein